MKILMVSRFFKPVWESGGVTRVSYELATQLLHLGNDVTVYTTNMSLKDYKVPLNKKTIVDGICVYYFDNLRRVFRTKLVSFPYYAPFIIRKHIKEYDVVHIHEYRSFLNLCVIHYARKYHIPYVIQPHGTLPICLPGQSPSLLFLKKIYDSIFGKSIISHAAALLYLSPIEKSAYLNLGANNEQLHCVFEGISAKEFCVLPERHIFRTKYNISESTKIILYLGRLHKTKGVDLLVEACYDILMKYNDALLILAGPDNGMLEPLKKLITRNHLEQRVLFTGALFGEDKIEAYVSADVFVIPSEYEAFALTALEAMSCGVPTIVSENVASKDVLRSYGCYVSKHTSKAYQMEILKILYNDEHDSAYYLNNVRSRILNDFNWTFICKKIEDIYHFIHKIQ